MARYCSIGLLMVLGISCSQDRGQPYSPPARNDVQLGGDGHPMNDNFPDGPRTDVGTEGSSGGDCIVGGCNGTPIVVAGTLDTSVAAVEFDSASVELRHKQDIDEWEDGCIVELNIHLKYGAGCRLDIRAGEAFGPDGFFQIQELTFLADSLCPSFPDGLEGTYVDKGNMVVAGVQLEATEVPGHNVSQSCVNTSFVIHLEGTLEEQQKGKTLAVNSTAITLSGDFSSTGSFAVSCPCKPSCDGLDCGDDGCGGSCGICPDGRSCQGGQCSVTCGDGLCGAGEDKCNCPGDCSGGCTGCCQGAECKGGSLSSECGKDGAVCSICDGGKTCQGQACEFKCGDGVCADGGVETQCSCADDCTTGCACCDGENCVVTASNLKCGKGAQACVACPALEACVNGTCQCQPVCSGKQCGPDGCGATCGTCPSGKGCQGGQCSVTCGDGQCGTGEDQCNCPGDCLGGCAGCCQGTSCKAGSLITECGKNGATCATCGAGKACEGGQCIALWWKDPISKLTWQVLPTGGEMKWGIAEAHCKSLSLDGGGWHLPTISELRSLVRGCPGTEVGGACKVTDSCLLFASCWDQGVCWSCAEAAGPADGCYCPDEMQGACSWFWSSSPVSDMSGDAWQVNFKFGDVTSDYFGTSAYSRCVR